MQPIKINLLRNSIVYTGLLIIRGPMRLSTLLFSLTRHETWADTRFFRSLSLIFIMVLYLLLALLSVYRLCEKQEGPMKRV